MNLGSRNDTLLTTATSLLGVVAIVVGAIIEPGPGAVLSMIGAGLILVRAVLGTTRREHQRRESVVRRRAAATPRTPWLVWPRPAGDPAA